MVGNITTDPHWVCPYVADQMGATFSPQVCAAMGLINHADGLAAGVVFENWNGRSIVAHMAVTGRLTREFIGAIFRYTFDQCGVQKVILPVSSGNSKSIRFVAHLGFTEEARIRDADPAGDIILFTLCKDDCRFLGVEYGQTIPASRT